MKESDIDNAINDLRSYTSPNGFAIQGIIKHLGIALQSADASLVACSDPKEKETVRESFLKKKLGLTDSNEDLDAAITEVCTMMKASKNKLRTTFYYLLAEKYDRLADFK